MAGKNLTLLFSQVMTTFFMSEAVVGWQYPLICACTFVEKASLPRNSPGASIPISASEQREFFRIQEAP